MIPNMVLFKMEDDLYDASINGEGEILSSMCIESDYVLLDNHIVFASFDTHTNSSKEICRFTIHSSSDESPRSIKEIFDKDGTEEIRKIVKHLFLNEVLSEKKYADIV